MEVKTMVVSDLRLVRTESAIRVTGERARNVTSAGLS